jgi:hypothetical protein
MLDGLLKLFCRLFEDKGAAQKQERAERKGTANSSQRAAKPCRKNNLAKKKNKKLLVCYSDSLCEKETRPTALK